MNPKRIPVLERRGVRREKAVEAAGKKLRKTQAWLCEHREQEKALRQRLEQFERDLQLEPQRLREFYDVRAVRIEPVGLVYLWPESN